MPGRGLGIPPSPVAEVGLSGEPSLGRPRPRVVPVAPGDRAGTLRRPFGLVGNATGEVTGSSDGMGERTLGRICGKARGLKGCCGGTGGRFSASGMAVGGLGTTSGSFLREVLKGSGLLLIVETSAGFTHWPAVLSFFSASLPGANWSFFHLLTTLSASFLCDFCL